MLLHVHVGIFFHNLIWCNVFRYIAGTEEGHIHRCSCSYNEQYLDSYHGHTVNKLCCKFSLSTRILFNCVTSSHNMNPCICCFLSGSCLQVVMVTVHKRSISQLLGRLDRQALASRQNVTRPQLSFVHSECTRHSLTSYTLRFH